MTFIDLALFVILPYAAIGQLVPAVIFRRRQLGALTESFEGRALTSERQAFAAWCAGIGAVVIALLHLVPLIAPPAWRFLIAQAGWLVLIEVVGLSAGCALCAGAALLFWRRTQGESESLRDRLELAALAALTLTALTGVLSALTSRWGAAWYSRALVPYLYSLFKLAPDVAPLSALGFFPRAHVALGFLSIGLAPFTTLPRQMRGPLRVLRGALADFGAGQ